MHQPLAAPSRSLSARYPPLPRWTRRWAPHPHSRRCALPSCPQQHLPRRPCLRPRPRRCRAHRRCSPPCAAPTPSPPTYARTPHSCRQRRRARCATTSMPTPSPANSNPSPSPSPNSARTPLPGASASACSSRSGLPSSTRTTTPLPPRRSRSRTCSRSSRPARPVRCTRTSPASAPCRSPLLAPPPTMRAPTRTRTRTRTRMRMRMQMRMRARARARPAHPPHASSPTPTSATSATCPAASSSGASSLPAGLAMPPRPLPLPHLRMQRPTAALACMHSRATHTSSSAHSAPPWTTACSVQAAGTRRGASASVSAPGAGLPGSCKLQAAELTR